VVRNGVDDTRHSAAASSVIRLVRSGVERSADTNGGRAAPGEGCIAGLVPRMTRKGALRRSGDAPSADGAGAPTYRLQWRGWCRRAYLLPAEEMTVTLRCAWRGRMRLRRAVALKERT
jgi:hypothetical protein